MFSFSLFEMYKDRKFTFIKIAVPITQRFKGCTTKTWLVFFYLTPVQYQIDSSINKNNYRFKMLESFIQNYEHKSVVFFDVDYWVFVDNNPENANNPEEAGGMAPQQPQIQQPRPQIQQPRPQIQQPRPQIQQPLPQIQLPQPQIQRHRSIGFRQGEWHLRPGVPRGYRPRIPGSHHRLQLPTPNRPDNSRAILRGLQQLTRLVTQQRQNIPTHLQNQYNEFHAQHQQLLEHEQHEQHSHQQAQAQAQAQAQHLSLGQQQYGASMGIPYIPNIDLPQGLGEPPVGNAEAGQGNQQQVGSGSLQQGSIQMNLPQQGSLRMDRQARPVDQQQSAGTSSATVTKIVEKKH